MNNIIESVLMMLFKGIYYLCYSIGFVVEKFIWYTLVIIGGILYGIGKILEFLLWLFIICLCWAIPIFIIITIIGIL